MRLRGRALCPNVEWSARPTRARYNKSLDASGTSGLVIRKTRMPTWLTAAASTQPFDGFFLLRGMKHLLFVVIALIGGYAVTLLCYMVGLVQPSLYLARLVS